MEEHSWIQEAADKIRDKLAAAAERNQGRLPFGRNTEQSKEDYFRTGNPFCWENGLGGGLMWQMVHATQDRTCMKNAVDLESALAGNLRSPEKLGPVAGYQFLPTAVANFHMTRNDVSKQRGLDAAKAMAGCFLPDKGYLALCPLLVMEKEESGRSRTEDCAEQAAAGEDDSTSHGRTAGEDDRVLRSISAAEIAAEPVLSVDSLLQLPLLYWASETTRDETYRGIASMHAAAVLHQLVREDGSVLPAAAAGSRADAQALALYGFGLSYLHTSDQQFLKAAEKTAAYFLSELPDSGRVPEILGAEDQAGENDFAAAAASCGLILLSGLVREDRDNVPPVSAALARAYAVAALRMLQALCRDRVDYRAETDTLLGDPAGDYFLTEAVWKLIGRELFIW